MKENNKISRRKVAVIACVCIVALAVLWGTVFFVWSNKLNNTVSAMAPADTAFTIEELEILSVKVQYEDMFYTMQEYMSFEHQAGDVVNVEVVYADGSVEVKPAYVTMGVDTTDVEYIDGAYGRIILPAN